MLRKSLHIIMAILVFSISTGFTMSKHYCGDSLKDVALFVEAPTCCDAETGCCHQENEEYKLDTDYSFQYVNIAFEAQVIELASVLDLVKLQFTESEDKDSFINFSPPPLKMQIVLADLQTYLL